MQVTKGTWRMREQCVPGSLFPSPPHESLGTRLWIHILITSTMGKFAAWFAGRLTCDSNEVSNSQDFEN